MKKNKFNSLLAAGLLVLAFGFGCKKDEEGDDLPSVTTAAVTDIKGMSATCGGDVGSEGSGPVTARGVCWSTSPNPSVDGQKTIDGTGTGTFTSLITGLSMNTTYYARAYATGSAGTAYGNEVSFTTLSVPSVGEFYQGGYIAYLLQPGENGYDPNVPHGLVAAPADQNTAIAWYNGTFTNTNATLTEYGQGGANTLAIVAAQGIGLYAAKVCNDLVLNGYDDWYLPSRVESNILYMNQAAIGGFDPSKFYWTSTEHSQNFAYYQVMTTGDQPIDYKSSQYAVRAVRLF